jgi:hypothetical protein
MSMMPLRVRLKVSLRDDEDDGYYERPPLWRDLLVACAPIALTGALQWWLAKGEEGDEEEDESEEPVVAVKPKRRAR